MNLLPIRHICAIGLTSFSGLLCTPLEGADLFGRSRQIVCNAGSTRHNGYRHGRVLASDLMIVSSTNSPSNIVQPVIGNGSDVPSTLENKRFFFPNRLELEANGIILDRVGLCITDNEHVRGQARIRYSGVEEQVSARITVYGLVADQESKEVITGNRIILWHAYQDISLRQHDAPRYIPLVRTDALTNSQHESVQLASIFSKITHFEVVVERIAH